MKNPEYDHLLGRRSRAAAAPMSDDTIVQNIRRWRIATARKTAND